MIRRLLATLMASLAVSSPAMADRIAIFSDRPGKIMAVLKNDLPRPRDPRSSEFFALEDAIFEHMKHHEHPPSRA